jgi:hypothetical protein
MEGEFAAVNVTRERHGRQRVADAETSPGSTITGRITFDGTRAPAARNLSYVRGPIGRRLMPLDGNLARADIHND